MRFISSVFGRVLEALDRRQFNSLVERHDGDRYDKRFTSWDHLIVLIFAQFSAATSLRGLEVAWNASRQHHYHLAGKTVRRSTLSDANRRRPVELFIEVFQRLAAQLDRHTRKSGQDMVRLIDATPIPLGALCPWVKSNGRIKGMKMHVVYAPGADRPDVLAITHANVNDAQIGRTVALEPGATYVFDKGFVHYGWWTEIDAAQAYFVTRPKTNMRLTVTAVRPLTTCQGDGFVVLDDAEVAFASKGDSKLPIRLRQVRLRRDSGEILTLITNDLVRSAIEIATLYKGRWQIELLFRWIKQHLRVGQFLGNNENAIRLQLVAAMIAYALLRIAARRYLVKLPILRFTNLVAQYLLDRRDLAAIERPPPVNQGRQTHRPCSRQLEIAYA